MSIVIERGRCCINGRESVVNIGLSGLYEPISDAQLNVAGFAIVFFCAYANLGVIGFVEQIVDVQGKLQLLAGLMAQHEGVNRIARLAHFDPLQLRGGDGAVKLALPVHAAAYRDFRPCAGQLIGAEQAQHASGDIGIKSVTGRGAVSKMAESRKQLPGGGDLPIDVQLKALGFGAI